METSQYIAVIQYCTFSSIDIHFVQELNARGLIQLQAIENDLYIAFEELPHLERFSRLFYDLEINYEGLEAIHHLLEQIHALQTKLQHAQSYQSLK